MKTLVAVLLLALSYTGCTSPDTPPAGGTSPNPDAETTPPAGSFAEAVAFLARHVDTHVLTSPDGALRDGIAEIAMMPLVTREMKLSAGRYAPERQESPERPPA